MKRTIYTKVETLQDIEPLKNSNEKASERWNPVHFGEVPRKLDETGNPTIFWDESIEPPDPDDFNSLKEYEEAWQEWETENSDNSICAAEWEPDSLSPDCSLENLNLSDSLKSMNTAAIASLHSTQESTITEMLMPLRENGGLKEESIYSVARHPVSPSQFRENEKLPTMNEIAFLQSLESLEVINQNTSVSKTSPDCSIAPTPLDTTSHISSGSLLSFTAAGTMQNGYVYLAEPLPAPLIEEDYCWLPAPTALSTRNSRPPGLNKLENFLKKNELIKKGEVLNPVILSEWFGIPSTWLDPSESRTAAELLEDNAAPPEIYLTPDLPRSPSSGYSTSTHSAPVKEPAGEYSTTLKAISLWQPWASLIPLGLKHYETRSWKTNYRGKLLICSTAANSKQHKEYLKICDELQLPPWSDFPHGQAIALCDLVDCIEMTPEFIAQQSQTEIKSGDWQVGRYAWKLENIQPITEPFAVKGKQGLFDIPSTNLECYLKQNFIPTHELKKVQKKSSDCWYTPPHIIELIIQVLGEIDLDPCADDGKHIPARSHYTFNDDGLAAAWEGRVFMNPPYSCPGVWMKKLQDEFELGRVREAIALVPAATDTKWLSPVLKSQPVCFWKGRIKFLDTNYQPKLAARQSHVLMYWGENWEQFKEVFDPYGVVYLPLQRLSNDESDKSLLGDKKINSPSQIISPSNSPSNNSGDKEESSPSKIKIISPSKKRLSGEGNGYIHWRTITLNDKEYPQAYYHWKEGKAKRSKYIPKKLLGVVEEADSAKHPVIEILKLLGVELDSHELLGDAESSPSNSDTNADISKSADKLLGDEWIKNGEINISQGIENSPSNLDTSPSKIEFSPSKRRKGDGSGSIHWRTITRGGKDYPQAYYHYEIWSRGDRLTKSSKYIPKRLLSQVQRLEIEKAPVKKILGVLGVVFEYK